MPLCPGTRIGPYEVVGLFPAGAAGRPWDVSRDGRRFIAIKSDAALSVPPPGADRQSFVFIVNWVEELKAKLDGNR